MYEVGRDIIQCVFLVNIVIVLFRSHGEPWSKFRSRVSKYLAAPEAARAAVPDLDRVTDDFIDRYVNYLVTANVAITLA